MTRPLRSAETGIASSPSRTTPQDLSRPPAGGHPTSYSRAFLKRIHKQYTFMEMKIICGRKVYIVPTCPEVHKFDLEVANEGKPEHIRQPCADCGAPATVVVLEGPPADPTFGWLWCNLCQVG